MKRIGTGILLCLVCFGVASAVGLRHMPDLITDWSIRDQPLTLVTDIAGGTGRCERTVLIVISTCDIDIKRPKLGMQQAEHTFHYIVFGYDKTVDKVISVMQTAGPQPLHTTNLGLKYLMSRTIITGMLVGGFALLGLWLLLAGMRRR
jgi:hypothetical protein